MLGFYGELFKLYLIVLEFFYRAHQYDFIIVESSELLKRPYVHALGVNGFAFMITEFSVVRNK